MQYLLSRACGALLRQLAQEQTLCAFDFDGTLSAITDYPNQAGLRAHTRALLAQVAARYPCVIISGRARQDVLGKLRGIGIARVIGNHGAETESDTGKWRGPIGEWKKALEQELGSIPGVWIEDKGLSLSVHYRLADPAIHAHRKILSATRHLRDARVFGGKRVVNLAMEGAPHKGAALETERLRSKCAWVLYLGDDETDEDAFALDGNIVSVRIGQSRRSHARYYLRTQLEVDKLLEQLIALREAGSLARP